MLSAFVKMLSVSLLLISAVAAWEGDCENDWELLYGTDIFTYAYGRVCEDENEYVAGGYLTKIEFKARTNATVIFDLMVVFRKPDSYETDTSAWSFMTLRPSNVRQISIATSELISIATQFRKIEY